MVAVIGSRVSMINVQIIVVLCLILGWYAEWRIHRRNYKFLMEQGALEAHPVASKVLYFVLVIAPFFIILEGLTYPIFLFESDVKAFFIGVLGASSALRWWAIDSVSGLWCYRCLAHPHLRHWAVGPYRFLGHPEYLSRILDVLSVAIIFNGVLSGLVFATIAIGMSLRLVIAEQSQYLLVRSLKNRD